MFVVDKGILLMLLLRKVWKRNRFLQDREIIFRTSKGFSRLSVSKRTQLCMALSVIGVVVWSAFSTVSYVQHGVVLYNKHQQIKQLSTSYDAAVQEKELLASQVSGLSNTVSELKKAESLVFERVEELASKEIDNLQKTLAGISPVLKTSGLSVDKLLKEMKSDSMKGQGGPFIPVEEVSLPDKELNAGYQSLNENLTKWKELKDLVYELPLGKPLKNFTITSSFGVRKDPFTGKQGYHKGMDMGAKSGETVHATAGGTVTKVSSSPSYGNLVEIQHKFGFKTRYAHLKKVSVEQGDKVDVGDVVGYVGNTGRSTGPHLHYEVQINDKVLNPYSFVKAQKDVF